MLTKQDFLHLIPEVPTSEIVLKESGFAPGQDPRSVLTRKIKPFKWSAKADAAAMALSLGYTIVEAADYANTSDRTIRRWKRHPEFCEEVDYLSHMVGIASRAERLRIVQRVVRVLVTSRPEELITEKDILEWLKFAQSETDGVKLDLAALLEASREMAHD